MEQVDDNYTHDLARCYMRLKDGQKLVAKSWIFQCETCRISFLFDSERE